MLTGMHPQGAESTATQYRSSHESIDFYLAKRLNTPEFLFKATGTDTL